MFVGIKELGSGSLEYQYSEHPRSSPRVTGFLGNHVNRIPRLLERAPLHFTRVCSLHVHD